MTDLYLIAHKVRGEPAFDIATQIECPECHDDEELQHEEGCSECDNTGFWWIIPTSGHRAYPATFVHLDWVTPAHVEMMKRSDVSALPDHYTTRAAPTLSLTEALGIHPKAPDLSRFTRRV